MNNHENMRIACVIPARLNSSRFPRKVLARLGDKTILERIWYAARAMPFFSSVTFAVDAKETAQLVDSFGGAYVETSVACPTGTDRIIELMNKKIIDADIWVGWQADSPFITNKMVANLLQSCTDDRADIWTLKKPLTDQKEVIRPNVVKVVCDANDFALYFSRSPIPYDSTMGAQKSLPLYFKHVGLYAYRTTALQKISRLKASSPLEKAEKLEQLRFLYYGLSIKVHDTTEEYIGIDLPQDLIDAEHFLEKNQHFL